MDHEPAHVYIGHGIVVHRSSLCTCVLDEEHFHNTYRGPRTANAHSPDLTHLLLFPTRAPSSRVRKRVFRCVQEDNSIEALIMNTRPVRSARQENSKFSQLLLRLHAQAQQTLLCLPVCGHRPSLEVPEVPKVPAPRVLHGVLTTSARM